MRRSTWLLEITASQEICKEAEHDLEVMKLEKEISYLQAVARARATPSWTFNAESTQSDKLAPKSPVTTAAVAASASSPVCHHQMLLNSGRSYLHFGEVEWHLYGLSPFNITVKAVGGCSILASWLQGWPLPLIYMHRCNRLGQCGPKLH